MDYSITKISIYNSPSLNPVVKVAILVDESTTPEKKSYGKRKHLSDAINFNKVEQLIFRTFNNQSIDEEVVYEKRKC